MRKLYLGNGDKQFKFADTATEIHLNAFDDGSASALTADAKVRIKNDSGYLLEISASVTDNHAVITSGQLAQLPVGSYLIELWDTVNGGTAIYPSDGFLALQINENVTGLSGGLVSSITVDDFIQQFSSLSKQLKSQVADAIANGLKGDTGSDGLSAYQVAVINGYQGSQAEWLTSLVGPKGDTGVFQSADIVDGSITIDKLAGNAQQTIFTPSRDGLPNYNTTTMTLDFNCYTDQAYFQVNNKIIQVPTNLVVKSNLDTASSGKLIFNIDTNEFSFITWESATKPNEMLLGTIRRSLRNIYYWQGSFDITIDGNDPKLNNLIRINADYVTSLDGLPTFDVKTNTLDFNCYVDQGYFVYNGKNYQVPKGTKIVATEYSSTNFTFRPSDMTFYAHGFTENIPADEVLFLSIRIGNYNNETVTTGTFPVDIIGQSFKLNATDNPIDAKIKGINHRGFNTVAPEESRAAYLLSKRNGYHHWEGDINWTKDNVPMMIHDLAINRTARNIDGSQISETVNITDLNYADLANYDFGIVKGSRFKGEPLLTFEELVKLARYNDVFLHIEFKYDFTQEQVQILHDIVVKYNMLDRIGWQAFGWDWLKPMMELEPNGKYELLGGNVTDDYFTKMAALKTDTNTIIASQNAALSVDDIQKIADKGYPIYLWTVDNGDTVRKFRDIGMVEGIMTDGNINVTDELARD